MRARLLAIAGLALACALPAGTTVHAQDCRLVEQYRFGSFTSAEGLSIDPFGDVYVTDAARHAVGKYRLDGTELQTLGGQGWGLDQLEHPAGVDARLGITVYVADRGNHRVLRYDRDLHALGSFSTRDDPDRSQSFGDPRAVAVSKLGALLIIDGENTRIVSTTGFASIDNSFGGVDAGGGRLVHPTAIAVDGDDNVFVLESDRVVVFDPFGAYRFTFGEGVLHDARGIAIHEQRGWIVTTRQLIPFDASGRITGILEVKDVFFANKPEEFRNIDFNSRNLLLLTAKNIIVLSCQQ